MYLLGVVDSVDRLTSNSRLLKYARKPRCRPIIAGAPSEATERMLLKGISFASKNYFKMLITHGKLQFKHAFTIDRRIIPCMSVRPQYIGTEIEPFSQTR